jgi:hypothetical protein
VVPAVDSPPLYSVNTAVTQLASSGLRSGAAGKHETWPSA